MREGAYVNVVGAPIATQRQLDNDVKSGCTVIADSREACPKESRVVILSGAEIHAEIGEVLAGKAGDNPATTMLFKVVRIATEDIFASRLVYEKAAE